MSLHRWREEETLLFEELRRVGAAFRYEQARWDALKSWSGWDNRKVSQAMVDGVRAYGQKQAAAFGVLAEQAEARFRLVQANTIDRSKNKRKAQSEASDNTSLSSIE